MPGPRGRVNVSDKAALNELVRKMLEEARLHPVERIRRTSDLPWTPSGVCDRLVMCIDARLGIWKELDECNSQPDKARSRLRQRKQPNGLYYFGDLQRYAKGLRVLYNYYTDAINELLKLLPLSPEDIKITPCLEQKVDELLDNPGGSIPYHLVENHSEELKEVCRTPTKEEIEDILRHSSIWVTKW